MTHDSAPIPASGHDCRRSWRPRRWVASWASALPFAVLGCMGCGPRTVDSKTPRAVSVDLRPVTAPLPPSTVRRTVYVPVYSSIYLGLDIKLNTVELTSTVSVRNVSPRSAIVIEFARYYDSAGRHVRDYVDRPAELPPLATVEFIVARADTTGGPGANFLIGWAGPPDVDEPLMEAVMVGQAGTAGISFTAMGRAVKNEAAR